MRRKPFRSTQDLQETWKARSISKCTHSSEAFAIHRISIILDTNSVIAALRCIQATIVAMGEIFAEALFTPVWQALDTMDDKPDMAEFMGSDSLK
jgi:hypothetical protein